MSAETDILNHAFIRMPCNVCGHTYEVPLRDVLLSHTVIRCGCPVREETECPPLFQIRLFDKEPIKALQSAWAQLAARAASDGGELILKESGTAARKHDPGIAEHTVFAEKNPSADGRIRQPVPTSGTILNFDLAKEVERLIDEQPWQAEHTANTIAKYPDLRVVLVALKARGRLHEHRTPGRISIQALSGDILVHLEGRTVEMHPGGLLTLEHNVPHEVEATIDSVFLLTIAWPK